MKTYRYLAGFMVLTALGYSLTASAAITIFTDDFQSETVGNPPSGWTKTAGGPFGVGDDGGNLYMGASTYNAAFTCNSVATFDAADLGTTWKISFDMYEVRDTTTWTNVEIFRLPGNYSVTKRANRGLNIYDSDGSLVYTAPDVPALTSIDTWVHYTISYAPNGDLTITGSNGTQSLNYTYAVSAADYLAHDQISFGAGKDGSSAGFNVDNVIVSIPEPASLILFASLFGLGFIPRRRSLS